MALFHVSDLRWAVRRCGPAALQVYRLDDEVAVGGRRGDWDAYKEL